MRQNDARAHPRAMASAIGAVSQVVVPTRLTLTLTLTPTTAQRFSLEGYVGAGAERRFNNNGDLRGRSSVFNNNSPWPASWGKQLFPRGGLASPTATLPYR
jgi:hypothetical protein